jgi:hypothetical protein
MMRRFIGALAATAAVGLAMWACGSSDTTTTKKRSADASGYTGTGGDMSGAPSGATGGTAAIPAERKLEKTFEAPVATARYVWSANPQTGRVALIDAETFQIRAVDAGGMPTWLTAIPGQDDRVLVINVGTSDASLLTSGANTVDERRYRLHSGANSWSVSDDGHFAIAWTDAVRVAITMGGDASVGNVNRAAGFQEITIIDLTAPLKPGAADVPPRLAVGFRPAQIVFAHGAPRAFAVTADGIDVLDLGEAGKPTIKRSIRYAEEPEPLPPPVADAGQSDADAEVDADVDAEAGEPDAAPDRASDVSRAEVAGPESAPEAPDVSITPDGAYAIVRREGSAQLDVVDLATAEHTTYMLAAPISDATLSPDNKNAVVVLRSLSEVDVVPIPPGSINNILRLGLPGEAFGRALVTSDGKTALLFTTVSPVPQLIALDLAAREYRPIVLHAPVLAVFPTPDAAHAVVLHDSYGGTQYMSPGAFSLVPLAVERGANIKALTAPPKQVAIAPDSKTAIVTARDDATAKYLASVGQMPALTITDLTLVSPPMSAGIVGLTTGYVAQEHPEGRVTFIDFGTGALHTVTGFELGASIYQWPARDGGQP